MIDFIIELKRRVRIEDVIEETVELERHSGHGYTRGVKKGVGEHGLVVDLDGQRFAWNGNSEYGNGRYNDVITWVMLRDRVDFWRAVEILAIKAGMEMPHVNEEQQVRFAAMRKQEDMLETAQRIFAGWLWKDERALAYARGRGWTDETIRKSGIGFTGWGKPEEYEFMKNAIAIAGDLHSPAAVAILGLRGGVQSWAEKRGITLKGNWIENNYIPSMLGWKDKFGLIYPCMLFGRTNYLYRRHLQLNEDGTELIESDEPKSYNLPRELVGERQLFYSHNYAPHIERLIPVEGPADAITIAQWDDLRRELIKKGREEHKDVNWLEKIPAFAAVAITGTAWEDHEAEIRLFKENHDGVYIGIDSDAAGRAVLEGRREHSFSKNGHDRKPSEWPLVEVLGAMCRIIEWPEKDANAWRKMMVKAEISDEDQIRQVAQQIGNALPMAVHVARWAGEQTDDDLRARAIKRAFEVIGQVDDEADVTTYIPAYLSAFNHGVSDEKKKMDTRQFNRLWKKINDKNQEGDSKEEVIYLYSYTPPPGGHGIFGDWIIDYCYDPETRKAKFAYRDPNGKVDEADELVIDGKKIRPMIPDDKMITKGAISFPSGLARKSDGSIDRKSTRELSHIIAAAIRRNFLFRSSKWPYLSSYWTLGTWLFDNFTELVYLRMVGDAGAGKSALLNLLGTMAFRSVKMSGADSESTFFRVVDDFRGTVMFEEADLPEGSGPENPIVKFVNLGAMRGNFIFRNEEVIRADGTKIWRPTPFETYCPKIFAMRGDFMDNAVASRAITLKLTAEETSELKENGIPLRLTNAERIKLLQIANLCQTWRLFEFSIKERELGWDLVDVEIPARFNQVTVPMKSLAVNVDGTRDEEFFNQITVLLREHYQDLIGDNATSQEARVAEACWKMYIYPDLRTRFDIKPDGTILVKIGDVTAIANNIMDEMNEEGADLRIKKEEAGEEGEKKNKGKKNWEMSAQKTGRIIREKFQLFTPPRNGKGIFFVWDDMKMISIGKKYGALPDAEKIEKARQELAAMRAKTPDVGQIKMEAGDEWKF